MMICFAGASSGTRIKTDLRVQAQKRWLVTALQISGVISWLMVLLAAESLQVVLS
jgi:hypothetical protein